MQSNSCQLHNQSVLVTGATGFVGSRLVRKLLAVGVRVTAVHLPGDSADSIADALSQSQIVPLDIRDADAVFDQMKRSRPAIVFHLAASVIPDRNPKLLPQMVDINYRGTVNVLNAAERLGNVRVVHMGSCEEYGDCAVPFQESQREQPLSPYALSKVAATYACLYYHRIGRVSAVVLRPTVIYGPGETRRSLFSSVVESCLQGQAPRTSPGQQTRDFVYVDDVVDACLRAAVLKEAAGRIINIGSGCESTVEHVVRMICESTGTDLSPEIGSLPYREHEIMRYVASVRVAKDVLGWTVSKSLEDGIGCLLDEMRRVIGLTESKDAGT